MFCFKMLLGILQRTVFSCRFKKAEINTQTLTLAKFSLSTQNVTFLAHDSYRSEMDLKIKVLLHLSPDTKVGPRLQYHVYS